MAILTEVKCGRCDKRYSALRGRCPYCGARRGVKGKYAGDPDDMRGRMIVGILILIALLAAVITLLIISVRSEPDDGTTPTPAVSAPVLPGDDDVTSITDGPLEVSPTPEETFVPPSPSVQSVVITYAGVTKTDITEKVGTTLTMKAKIDPEDIELVPEWSSSDPAVFEVVATDTGGLSAKVTILGKGNATLTVTVGDKTAECIVRGK